MLCKKLCEMAGFDKLAAMNGGAEAVDMAIKFAALSRTRRLC